MAKAPAYISHTVLVHAGSYSEFLAQLTAKYPLLQIKFVKKVAIHYYILQLEDHSTLQVKKEEIYKLPIMALREEFSGFIFFKSTKAYNNVLKRMCNASNNEMAAYDLVQHMLTPFEKSALLGLEDAQSLEYKEVNDKNETTILTIFRKEEILSMKTLNKLFGLEDVKVNGEDKTFSNLVKEKSNWTIGIH